MVTTIVNQKAKGKRIERKAEERLSRHDFKVEKPVEKKYGRTDFFGLFDIIAIRGDCIKFIQVKSNQARQLEEYKKKTKEFLDTEKFDVEYWIWHDNDGWRIKQIRDGEWEQILDERE